VEDRIAWYKEVEDPETGEIVVVRTYNFQDTFDPWQIVTMVGGYRVSTGFLPTPHIGGHYETMVFDDDSVDQERYKTRDEAEKGHERMVTFWRQRLGLHLFDAIAFLSSTADGGANAYDEDANLLMELSPDGARKAQSMLEQRAREAASSED
jgi:hypothetical protein